MKKDGRRILFEGISNCRDLGGLQNVRGQRIREGLLLRSAHLRNATPTDVLALKEIFSLKTQFTFTRNLMYHRALSVNSIFRCIRHVRFRAWRVQFFFLIPKKSKKTKRTKI